MPTSSDLFTRDELIAKFGWEEYLVFGLMLAASAGIGVYFWWRGQKNNRDFLLGGKNQGTLPVALSIVTRWDIQLCFSDLGKIFDY